MVGVDGVGGGDEALVIVVEEDTGEVARVVLGHFHAKRHPSIAALQAAAVRKAMA